MVIVNSLDAKEESFVLTSDEIQETIVAKDDWAKIILMDEICWRLKTGALWLNAGDCNTKVFHRMANINLSSVVADGVHYDVPRDTKYAIHDTYKSLLAVSEP